MDRIVRMRYQLRTLTLLAALAPPVIAWLWLNQDWLAWACVTSAIIAYFSLWFWMLHKSQSMAPRTLDTSNHDYQQYPPEPPTST